MPARQVARFPLGGGIDLKSDGKHVPVPKLEALSNVDLSEDGAIKKRRAIHAGPESAGMSMTDRRVSVTETRLTEHSDAAALGVSDETSIQLYTTPVSASHVVRANKQKEYNLGTCVQFDGHLYCLVNEHDPDASSDRMVLLELDPVTFVKLNAFQQDHPSTPPTIVGTNYRLVAMNNSVVAVWLESTGLRAQRFKDGEWAPSSIPLNTNIHASREDFDVCANDAGDAIFIAYPNSVSTLSIARWEWSGGTFNSLGFNRAPVKAADDFIAITHDHINGNLLCLHGGSYGVEIVVAADDLKSDTEVVVDAAATGGKNATVAMRADADTAMMFYEEEVAAAPVYLRVVQRSIDTSTRALHPTPKSINGMRLAHKAFWSTTSLMFYAGFERVVDDLECQYFTFASGALGAVFTPQPAVRYADGVASGVEHPSQLSSVAEVDTATGTRHLWFAPIRSELRGEEGDDGEVTILSNLAGTIFEIDFSFDQRFEHTMAHGGLAIAGGIPSYYDGSNVVEMGFLNAPLVTAVPKTGGSLTPSSVYRVRVIYEHMDGRGRIWRSRPSVAVSVTLGGGDSAIDVEMSAAVVKEQNQYWSGVTQYAVYVTTAGGTSVFYRSSPHAGSSSFPADVHVGAYATHSIMDSDSTHETREVLYTDTGELPNYPPPPCRALTTHGDRLVCIHSETGDIWLSKSFRRGDGIGFSDQLVIRNADVADRPVAVVSTDSALIVLYRKRVGFVYGDGPNNQGLGQSWGGIDFLPESDVGADSAKSVLKLPMGILFHDSERGVHLLPYGGGPAQYVGRDLGGALSGPVIGGANLTDRSEARLVFHQPVTDLDPDAENVNWVTWHYDRNQWSTGKSASLDNLPLMSAGAFRNAFELNGELEEDGAGLDGLLNDYVEMKVRTGWIVLSEATRKQGQHRLFDVYAFAESKDPHDLRVQMYFDYDESAGPMDDTKSAHADDRVRVWPTSQKIEAFKLEISDSSGAGTVTGEGFKLSDIELHYGVYPGIRPRIAPGKRMAG